MSKISYAAMSLIGAVPGGYLSYLTVMAMLNYFSKMPGIMRVVVCAIFALAAFVTVIPIGILIFVKSEKEEAESESDDVESLSDSAELEEVGEEDSADAAGDLPDFEAAGVTDSEESVMIEHEEAVEEIDDIYEADDDLMDDSSIEKK